MVMVRLVPPSYTANATSTSQTSHRVVYEADDSSSFSQRCSLLTLLISALGPAAHIVRDIHTYTHTHVSDVMIVIKRAQCVGAVRVREIMRPPTNQSIRRHLSDCSLTSRCPAPPFLLVARVSPSPPLPVYIFLRSSRLSIAAPPHRKRTDAGHPRARVIAYPTRISERGWRMWITCRDTGIGLEKSTCWIHKHLF